MDGRRLEPGDRLHLFHEDVPGEFIIRVLRVIEKCPKHTFMILTKRPDRMLDVIGGGLETGLEMEPLPNLWLGVSAENQETADQRIYPLLRVPAAVRFVSCEPLLGPIDFFPRRWLYERDGLGACHCCAMPDVQWPLDGLSSPNNRPRRKSWWGWYPTSDYVSFLGYGMTRLLS